MSKLICFTSQCAVGCTFLDWSVNFLAGRTRHLHRHRGWSELVSNPVTGSNAHRHQKNHPVGLEETQHYVDFLTKNTDFATLYPVAQLPDIIAKQQNIPLENISAETWNSLTQQQLADFNNMLQWLSDANAKIVYVSLNQSLPLYQNTFRSTERVFYTGQPGSADHARDSIDKVFFQDSIDHWSKLSLATDIWDVRERMALDLRPFEYQPWQVNLSVPHLWIDSQELWYNGKSKIVEIMHWLELDIDAQRHSAWTSVFDQWQQIQLNVLKFQYNYQHIVDSIIHGWSYPIDLTFDQEVVIQHCLIYQHNLNLKTWQLAKFPNNTKDLHALLEPNIHPVENIYQHTR